jgi:pimeloyl-ACP methyl ester carboxylesterase
MQPVPRRGIAAAVLLGAVSCGEAEPSALPSATLPLTACRLPGADRAALCGTLARAVDPADPTGPTIDIAVAVVPARRPSKRHPLYFFAGGPGQGAIAAFAPLLGAFEEIGRERDLVLVDQRGTGDSAPLRCVDGLDKTIGERLAETPDLAELSRCVDGYEHDPRLFVTTIAVDDLDAVRQALGHEVIDVIGGSYGTRAAMVYARAHGEHTGRIVLDGVAPVDMALPQSFAVDAQAALDAMFSDCAATPTCAAAFPDARARFEAWMASLRAAPIVATVPDPRTGEPMPVTLGAREIAAAIRGLLYAPVLTSLLPLTMEAGQRGDLGPLVSQAALLSEGISDSMAQGMFLSVVCAEDVPFLDEAEVAAAASTAFGRSFVDELRASCGVWPTAELAPGYRSPIALSQPTLVLSGALDPVTPPRWGEHVLPHLSAGRHVVVPGAGHGTMSIPCVTDMIQAFLDGSDTLEVGCIDDVVRPPFFVDRAGPPA